MRDCARNRSLNSAIFCLPFALAASAIAQSGCRWSTCAKRKKAMQRSVDRSRYFVCSERGRRIQSRPSRLREIRPCSSRSTVPVCPGTEERIPIGVMEPKSPPLPFTAKHAHRLSGERIGHIDFRAGVATCEICDAKVGAEQVRAVTQQVPVGRFNLEAALSSQGPSKNAEGCVRGFWHSVLSLAYWKSVDAAMRPYDGTNSRFYFVVSPIHPICFSGVGHTLLEYSSRKTHPVSIRSECQPRVSRL